MSDSDPVHIIQSLPSPRGHFLWGHLQEFREGNHSHQVLERWARECGYLFRIRLANQRMIVSLDPNFNREVLAQRPGQFRRLGKLSEIIKEMGVLGVFNAEGDTWKRHRIPIARALNAKKIKAFYPLIESKTQSLIRKLDQFAESGEEVDIQKEFRAFTVDVTTALAFGYELDMINERKDAFQTNLEIIFPMISERVTTPLPFWRWFKSGKDRKLESALQFIEQIVYQFIDDARKRLTANPELGEHPSNLLEMLLAEQEENQLSDKEVYGNVFTMLLAGEDTTANSLAWALYFMAQRPEIVQKIRKEDLDGVYVRAVVQETLRMKPVSPQLLMEANQEVVVQNLRIPKGMKLLLQNKAAQHQSHYFSRPDEFLPERWHASCPHLQHHSPEVIRTFGGGPRFCPGKYLAMQEMVTVLSALCKQYDFELAVDSGSIQERLAFTMFPENLKLRLQKKC